MPIPDMLIIYIYAVFSNNSNNNSSVDTAQVDTSGSVRDGCFSHLVASCNAIAQITSAIFENLILPIS